MEEELEGGSLDIKDAANSGPDIQAVTNELNEIKRKLNIIKTPSMRTTFLQKQMPWFLQHFAVSSHPAAAFPIIEKILNAQDITPFLKGRMVIVQGGQEMPVYIFDGGEC